jgi:hypothetical protein
MDYHAWRNYSENCAARPVAGKIEAGKWDNGMEEPHIRLTAYAACAG